MDPPNQDAAPPPDLKEAPSHPEPPQASPGGAPPPSPARIPKKNQPSIEPSGSIDLKLPSLSQNETRSNSFDNGGSLVLPDGVQLPPSVTPQMMDGRLRRSLIELSPAQMKEVLTEYDEAVREKGGEIRNHAAYLFGVIKRYKSLQDRSLQGGNNAVPQGTNLSDQVQARLNTLVSSGFCTSEELDMKIKDRMRMLPERDALDSIDEMNGCSRGEIRNFGSYFMGIMNRYMRGERQNPQSRGSNRARNNIPHGNNNRDGRRYDDRNRDNHRDTNMGNDNRFSHYGRNDNQSSAGRNDRRDGRDRRSSRDSDRDHYRSRRRRSRSRSRSYDSRSRSRSRSPRDRRRRSRSRSDSRERYRSRRRDHSRDSRRSSSHRDSNGSSKVPYGQNQPPMAHMLPPPPPPPPRPPNMMQPIALGQQQLLLGQPPQMMPGGLQRPMQPPQQQFMQPIPQMGQGAFLQQPQPQLLQQQFQQPVPGSMQQPPIQMQPFNQNMPQAPKMMIPGSQVAGLTNMLLGQPSPANWQGQNQSQPPVDILGIADKAALALSGRIPQQNAPAPMSNPNFPPPPAAFSHRPQQNMTTVKDLPMMVQYAVQNLRTTGHIEQTLDSPLCAMLKRLPEAAALQSLEIFSSCDLSKMRNKSAYLSGILKKELIKLGLS